MVEFLQLEINAYKNLFSSKMYRVEMAQLLLTIRHTKGMLRC